MKQVDERGTIRYYNESCQYHREDGPAIEYVDGSKFWYRNGLRHREDGPASEWGNGDKEYWIDETEYTEEEYRLILFTQYGKTI